MRHGQTAVAVWAPCRRFPDGPQETESKAIFPSATTTRTVFEQLDLLNEVRPAALKFNSARFIIRRRAPNGGGNVTIREFQTVISMNRVLLIGETGSVERAVEPVATAIAGKHSAGSIAAVGRRRETDNQQTRIRIAETR